MYDVGINTITGTAILKEIYTIGLNADYIKTGSLSANRIQGGILKLGGQNNGYGEIEVYNSNDVLVGEWKNTSFETYSANFTGAVNIGNKTLQDKYWIEMAGIDNNYLGEKIQFLANGSSNNSTTYDFTIGMQEDSSGVIGAMFNLTNRANFIGIQGVNNRSFWYQRTAESHSTLGEIEADTINSSVDFDMHDNIIKNAGLDDVGFSGNVSFLNNANVNFYCNVDLHNFAINNLCINNIVGVGSQDKQPITATFPYVKTITENADGGIDWTYGDLTFENGILVGY